jgi:curli production assembly/transport component CsgF
MKKKLCAGLFLAGLLFLTSGTVSASQLVFEFQNPSFPGGNPLTGTFLLNSAQAQNKFREVRPERSTLERFNEALTRQVMHRLASRLIATAFGEEGISPGHYQIGNFTIDITKDIGGLTVHMVDISTGGKTTVQIPYY